MKLFNDIDKYELVEDQSIAINDWPAEQNQWIILCYEHEFGSEQKTLLAKILNAIQLDLNDCIVRKLKKDDKLKLSQIPIHRESVNIFCFGINPINLGLQIDVRIYKRFHISNKNLVFCHSLVDLDKNQEAKKALWTLLKNEFLIS